MLAQIDKGSNAPVKFINAATYLKTYAFLVLSLIIIYQIPELLGSPTWIDLISPTSGQIRQRSSGIFGLTFNHIRDLLHREFWGGTLSFWMSSQVMGSSLVDQLSYGTYNPFEFLYIIIDRKWWTLIMANQLAIAGLVLFVICIEILNTSIIAGLAAAFIYVVAGNAYVSFDYQSETTGMIAQALILCGALGLITGRSAQSRHFLFLACGLMLALVGENPQYWVMQAIYMTPVILLVLLATWAGVRRCGLLILAGAVGLMLASPDVFQVIRSQVDGSLWSAHRTDLSGGFYWNINWMWLTSLTSPWLFNWNDPGVQWLDGIVTAPEYSVSIESFSVSLGFSGLYLSLLSLCDVGNSQERDHEGTYIHVSTVRRLVAVGFFIGLAFLALRKIFPYLPPDFVNIPRYSSLTLAMLGCLSVAIGFDNICSFVTRPPRNSALRNALVWGPALLAGALPIGGLGAALYAALKATHSTHAVIMKFGRADIICLAYALTPIVTGAILLFAMTRFRDSLIGKRFSYSILIFIMAECILIVPHPMQREFAYFPICIFVLLSAAAVALTLNRVLGLFLAATALGSYAYLVVCVSSAASLADRAKASEDFYGSIRSAITENGFRRRIVSASDNLAIPLASASSIPVFGNNMPLISSPELGIIIDTIRPRLFTDMVYWTWDGIGEVDTASRVGLSSYLANRAVMDAIGIFGILDRADGAVARKLLNGGAEAQSFDIEKIPSRGNAAPPMLLFKSRFATPRVYFSNSYETVPFTPDAWASRQWLKENAARIPGTVVIEASEDFPPSNLGIRNLSALKAANHAPASARVRAITDIDGFLRFMVDAPAAGIVVINESYHRGWVAKANGQKLKVLRANGAGIGLVLPSAGQWEIEMHFAPDAAASKWTCAAGLLLLGITFLALKRRPGDAVLLTAMLPLLAAPLAISSYMGSDDGIYRACPLVADRVGGGVVELKWCGAPAASYAVEMAKGDGNYVQLGKASGSSTFNVTGTSPDVEYRFRVTQRRSFVKPKEVTLRPAL